VNVVSQLIWNKVNKILSLWTSIQIYQLFVQHHVFILWVFVSLSDLNIQVSNSVFKY
jgi:hypothetical protein